jgi:hypothetical protein
VSYCRIGIDSDVYVIHHVGDGMACYCVPAPSLMTKQEMVEHLLEHREEGLMVPQRALDRLYREIAAEQQKEEDENDE